MHSKWVWSINHDLTTSLGLSRTPIFLKSYPTWYKGNSIRADPSAHSQHIKVLKHSGYIDMDVGCTPSGYRASTMILYITQAQ